MSASKPLLVLGATGKQGRKLIETLLSTPDQPFTILALTRNPDTTSAKALAAKSPTIKLVRGNLDDVPLIFEAALEATGGAAIWGVFSVQQAVQDGATQERETKQGKDVVDGAIAHGVKVFVYTSVDRGGEKSDTNPTNVPHFISKYEIEKHLKEKAKGQMTWTILRPVAFMDGLTPNFLGKVFATWVKIGIKPSRKLAFIATSDIGYFAAQAFLQNESPDYKNKAITIAGDELSFEDMDRVFKERRGYGVPYTYEFVGRFIKWMLTELNIMFKWFDDEGFGADVKESRRLNPGLMTFGDWVEKESGFPSSKKQ